MTAPPVNALLRGLLVLEAVNAYGPLGLSAIQRHTGIPKATAHRLLESLRQAGYLTFDAQTSSYNVSLRALALANNISPEHDIVEVARPIMDELRLKLGWPSDLAVFQHDKMVIIDTNRQAGMLSSNRSIGSRVPMMASATGRAYLAGIHPAERARLINLLSTSSDPFEKLAKTPGRAEKMIEETVKRGYALSNQEFLKTNRGAAVAVMHGDIVACVINLIAIASLVEMEELERRFVPMLIQAKAAMEGQLRSALPSAPSRSKIPIGGAD